MKIATQFLAVTLAVASSASGAWAQTAPADTTRPPRPEPACGNPTSDSVHTFYLHNSSQPNEANELATALRNMLPSDARSFLVSTQNAVVVCAHPDQIALAQKLINDLDRPRKNYRLTYTVTEIDGARRIGSQHFAMIIALGGKTSLKLGSRVPYTTGTSGPGSVGVQRQWSYLDVGMNIEASLDELANGARLRSRVEQSGFANAAQSNSPDQKPDMETQPVIRQATLEGASYLTVGKPAMIGSLDVPSSTRHLDIEVLMEEVR